MAISYKKIEISYEKMPIAIHLFMEIQLENPRDLPG